MLFHGLAFVSACVFLQGGAIRRRVLRRPTSAGVSDRPAVRVRCSVGVTAAGFSRVAGMTFRQKYGLTRTWYTLANAAKSSACPRPPWQLLLLRARGVDCELCAAVHAPHHLSSLIAQLRRLQTQFCPPRSASTIALAIHPLPLTYLCALVSHMWPFCFCFRRKTLFALCRATIARFDTLLRSKRRTQL